MFRKLFLVAITLCLGISIGAFSQENAGVAGEPALHIDIPTKLEMASVVIDFGHIVFVGDMPFARGDIHLRSNDLRDWNATGQVVFIFHGDASFLVLNDETYNTTRHVITGNPYNGLLNELMNHGVQPELCGATAMGNHLGNTNLHPGVKVNRNAMVRLTQLEQEGFTMIYQ